MIFHSRIFLDDVPISLIDEYMQLVGKETWKIRTSGVEMCIVSSRIPRGW